MSTFFGTVRSPTASGPFVISLPDSGEGNVSGNLKIGAPPRMALTGFSGQMTGPTTFEASGQNTRGRGIYVMFLVLSLSGYITADGKHIAGTMRVVLNGNEEPEWTFSGATKGAAPLEQVTTASGQLVYEAPPEEKMGVWSKVPTGLKVTLGAVAAALGGLLVYRQTR